MNAPAASQGTFLTPSALLEHWQGQRRLTRRMIELFPEDQLFSFSLGGMRPFGKFVIEFLQMAGPTVEGIATNNWADFKPIETTSRAEMLRLWDASTETMNKHWPSITTERFHETMKA